MERPRRLLLIAFVSVFAVVAGVLAWSAIRTATSQFPAGTRPVLAESQAPDPTLPPLRADNPSRGNPATDAVTVVEFADFSNANSRLAEIEIKKALGESPRPFKIVWRDLPPLSNGIGPTLASLAGRCAADQGKFWPMHDALLMAGRLDLDSIKYIAQQQYLNTDAFNQCMDSGKYLKSIEDDVALAQTNHITQVPTFFIGKKFLTGLVTAAEIESAVSRAYKRP